MSPGGMNWNAARKRDLVRDRGFEAARGPGSSTGRRPEPPTSKQLDYLADLALKAGVRVPDVRTRAEVAREIDRLVNRQRPTSKQRSYLDQLAAELDVAVPRAESKSEASRAIRKLEAKRDRRNGR